MSSGILTREMVAYVKQIKLQTYLYVQVTLYGKIYFKETVESRNL